MSNVLTHQEYCENGLRALHADSPLLYTWTVPTKQGNVRFRTHRGAFGFVLMHFILWYAETIEPLVGKVLDDWSWAWRWIRGSVSRLSNHAGYAVDLNSMRHPIGRSGTMRGFVKVKGVRVSQYAAIRARLLLYGGTIKWGGDYRGRKDEMHYENRASLERTEKVARRLANTPRGKRILAANPGQRAVIFS